MHLTKAAACLVFFAVACTADQPGPPNKALPSEPLSVVVPDVEKGDLRAGYEALTEAGLEVTWNRAFKKSSDFLKNIRRYARGVGPRPPYSWILKVRPRPGTELEPGAKVTIMHIMCPTGYYKGPCVKGERDGLPSASDEVTRQVVADCFHGSIRPRRMTLACGDNGFRARQLEWSHWGRRRAVGEGVFLMNDCDPGCVVGTFHRRTGRIVLSDSRACEELNAYVFISGKVVFDKPFEGRRFNKIYPGCPS